ncbi:MAG: metal ABC transporter substrate-binding protein [Elusimicrobiota bacterium]
MEKESTKIKVVTTTTHLGSIAAQIGKEKIEVIILVPGSMCPGHFDMEPVTMKKISRSKLLISHSWEKWIENLLAKIDNKNILKKQISTQGNWMIPEVNVKAAAEVAGLFSETDVLNKGYYQKNLKDYASKVEMLRKKIKTKTQYEGIKALCSEQQKDFLLWLGLDIVKTYGRPEDLNIRELANIMALAKKEKTRLVVDNLQSGANAGLQLAKDLKIKHVTLSNFPLEDSYFKTLENNIETIDKALNE